MTEANRAPCPCGSGEPESACCRPFLSGAPAPTALALMRSRYTAYVRGEIDYIMDTHDPKTRGDVDREATERWSRETAWEGLEIKSTEAGGATDGEGEVEFIARGSTNGTPFVHHERSWFRREGGRWYYTRGQSPPPRRKAPTVGRNEPCPCGSGKKYKKCHGA